MLRVHLVTDVASLGVQEYVTQLRDSLRRLGVEAHIRNWNDRLEQDPLHHFHYSNSTVRIVLPLVRSHGPKVVTVHDVTPINPVYRRVVAPVLFRLMQSKFDHMILHTKHGRDVLQKYIPDSACWPISIIPHGTHIRTHGDRGEILRRYGICTDAVVLLAAGDLKKAKGILQVLAAFDALPESIKLAARLLLVGRLVDRDVRSRIEDVGHPGVRYLGFLPRQELLDLLYASDALLSFRVTTMGETSGPVAYALGAGTPILGSDIASTREVAGPAGLYCSPDVPAINRLLRTFISNANLRDELGRRAVDVGSRYEWSKVSLDHLALYKEVVGGSNSGKDTSRHPIQGQA